MIVLSRAAMTVAAFGVMAFQSAGVVSGRVTDANGKPLAGVVVTVAYRPTGGAESARRSVRTDARGRYSIPVAAPPGGWSLQARARFGPRSVSLTVHGQTPRRSARGTEKSSRR